MKKKVGTAKDSKESKGLPMFLFTDFNKNLYMRGLRGGPPIPFGGGAA